MAEEKYIIDADGVTTAPLDEDAPQTPGIQCVPGLYVVPNPDGKGTLMTITDKSVLPIQVIVNT